MIKPLTFNFMLTFGLWLSNFFTLNNTRVGARYWSASDK